MTCAYIDIALLSQLERKREYERAGETADVMFSGKGLQKK